MTIKTKEIDEVTSQHMTSHSNEKRRTKKELTSVLTPALLATWRLKKIAQYEASKLKASSMKGLETDEDFLIEISAQGPTRSCRKLTVYKEMYKSDLEKDIVDTSGDFQKLMFAKGRRAAVALSLIIN